MNDEPIVKNRDIAGILLLCAVFISLGLCCAGCNGYYTQRERDSMIGCLQRAQAGISQSKTEFGKIGVAADKNQINWVGAAAQAGQWTPEELRKTQSDINAMTEHRGTFAGQLDLADTLIGSVKTRLEGGTQHVQP